jgi:hypothetical protein
MVEVKDATFEELLKEVCLRSGWTYPDIYVKSRESYNAEIEHAKDMGIVESEQSSGPVIEALRLKVRELEAGIDRNSSVEIGTPGKGGVVKCRFDPEDMESARRRADNSLEIRNYMAQQMNGGAQP